MNPLDLRRIAKVTDLTAVGIETESFAIQRRRRRTVPHVLYRYRTRDDVEHVARLIVGMELGAHGHRLAEAQCTDDLLSRLNHRKSSQKICHRAQLDALSRARAGTDIVQ